MPEVFSDTESYEPKLNRVVIIDSLQELGFDIELADWIAYDDSQILADLATYSVFLEVGMDDLFEACHIEIEENGDTDEI